MSMMTPSQVDLTSMEKRFVRAYRELPHLWRTGHVDYTNKPKRNQGYDILLNILRTHVPGATRFTVRQKINILRSCYRKELRKHLDSKTITPEGELHYNYIPSTWKFKAMRFLDNDLIDADNRVKDEVVIQDNIDDESMNEITLNYEEQETENECYELEGSDSSKIRLAPLRFEHFEISNGRKRNKMSYSDDELIDRECNSVGANVACKLQRMSSEQRYRAELLINKLLIKGLNENLTDDTDITNITYIEEKSDHEC